MPTTTVQTQQRLTSKEFDELSVYMETLARFNRECIKPSDSDVVKARFLARAEAFEYASLFLSQYCI